MESLGCLVRMPEDSSDLVTHDPCIYWCVLSFILAGHIDIKYLAGTTTDTIWTESTIQSGYLGGAGPERSLVLKLPLLVTNIVATSFVGCKAWCVQPPSPLVI